MDTDRQQAHQLLDQLGPGQVAAVVHLLKAMLHEADDELTDEDRRAVSFSREYFRRGGEGLSFEQVVADLGFSMEQVLGRKSD